MAKLTPPRWHEAEMERMLKAAGFEEPPTAPPTSSPKWADKEHLADMTPTVASDMVSLPRHYARYKIEPITFICENKLDFYQGNIVKYVCRHDAKNGLEDILKVIRYGIMYYRFLAGDPDWAKQEPYTQAIKAKFEPNRTAATKEKA